MTRFFIYISILLLSGDCFALLVPHRITYQLSLTHKTAQSKVQDLQGTMTMEINKICDQWYILQNSMVSMVPDTMHPQTMVSNYISYESEKRKRFHFVSQQASTNSNNAHVAGNLIYDAARQYSHIALSAPKNEHISLPYMVLTPVQHLEQLIEAGQKDVKTISHHVFDGTNYGQSVHVHSFITRKFPDTHAAYKNKNAWYIRQAIYNEDQAEMHPVYEIEQILNDQGIVTQYTLNMGSYTVTGEVKRVEYL